MLFGEGPKIKNIAADLNNLFRQGTLLNQSGQTVEGDSTADQGTSDLLAAGDPVIQEISVGISGEQAERYTVSGTPPLSLPNSLGKPLKAWSVDVSPYQNLNGYANPWPAGGGVNKLPPVMDDTYTYNDVTITSKNGVFTISGTASAGFNSRTFALSESVDMSPSTNKIAFLNSFTNGSFTVDFMRDTTRIHYWGMSENNRVASGWSDTGNEVINGIAFYVPSGWSGNVTISPMFVLLTDSNPTAFTPYSNICPINGTDKVNLYAESSYDPSATPKAVITLPQTVYTGTVGSEGGESRWGELTTNSAKTINYNNAGAVPYVWLAFQDGKQGNAATQGNCITSIYAMNNQTFYDKHAKMYGTGIEIYDSDFTDRETALTLLTNFVAVYKLITPQTFSLTAHTIPTPRGTATAWATAEDGTVDSMDVTYIGKA